MPSASATALVDYFEGRRLLDRPDTKSDAEDAIAAFQRAVAADPHFVMAVTRPQRGVFAALPGDS